MNTSKLRDLLAVLGTSAVALGGCGGAPAPVAGAEVPAASSMPSAMPSATPSAVPAAMAPAADTAAAMAKAPAAAAAPMPKSADMPKGNHTVKVADSKRAKGCEGGCGEGTCGSPCK